MQTCCSKTLHFGLDHSPSMECSAQKLDQKNAPCLPKTTSRQEGGSQTCLHEHKNGYCRHHEPGKGSHIYGACAQTRFKNDLALAEPRYSTEYSQDCSSWIVMPLV